MKIVNRGLLPMLSQVQAQLTSTQTPNKLDSIPSSPSQVKAESRLPKLEIIDGDFSEIRPQTSRTRIGNDTRPQPSTSNQFQIDREIIVKERIQGQDFSFSPYSDYNVQKDSFDREMFYFRQEKVLTTSPTAAQAAEVYKQSLELNQQITDLMDELKIQME